MKDKKSSTFLFGLGGKKQDQQYFLDLSMQVVGICIKERDLYGGMIPVEVILDKLGFLRAGKSSDPSIPISDISKAVELLEPLKSGYKMLNLGSVNKDRYVVQCLPRELGDDTNTILKIGSSLGFVSWIIMQSTGWSRDRFDASMVNIEIPFINPID